MLKCSYVSKFLLLIWVFLSLLNTTSNAFECTSFLRKTTLIDSNESIRRLVPFHRLSKDLSVDEKELIKAKIQTLRNSAKQFNKSYNDLFQDHGTEFLSDLRFLFEKEESLLRSTNQILINELNRFLKNEGTLVYRNLDLLPAVRTLDQIWGLVFLKTPNKVYFNLSYFISSRLFNGKYEKGYAYSEDGHMDLRASVHIYEDQSDGDLETNYPASEILIPRSSKNNLIFPGLPLDIKLIDFLKEHGVQGRLQVAPQTHYRVKASLLSSLTSKFQAQKRVPLFTSRWSSSRKKHFDIVNEDGKANLALFNLSNYFEQNSHLMVPTLPVIWNEKHKNIFRLNDDQRRINLIVTKPELADFSVAPTPFEFIVALIELIQM